MSEAKFASLQNELFALFQNGKINEVHSLIDEAHKSFPERIDKTIFWRACAYSVQNKLENAVNVLQNGLEKGIWWNPFFLKSDPDLSNLQDHNGFQLVLKECQNRLESTIQNAKSKLFTYGNQQADTGIFALHMRGNYVKDFSPHWLSEDTLNNYFFGFPQSSQVFSYNAYCWDNQEIAEHDITKAFKEYKELGNINQTVLAGASQGGKLAIELSMNQKVDSKGFIAVIPAIKDVSAMSELIQSTQDIQIRGCIITGNQDPFYKNTKEITQLFEQQHIPCKLIVVDGLGHFFPDNFPELLTEAVDFVLNSQENTAFEGVQ